MGDFANNWHDAATTSVGLFWMAFWAFGLGYLISSMIQVFVTRERMRQTLGTPARAALAWGRCSASSPAPAPLRRWRRPGRCSPRVPGWSCR